MRDPHETKIGIVSDSTRRGTLVVDTDTDKWPEKFPPVRYIKYEKVQSGVMVATFKMGPVPARIKGVVTSVEWMRRTSKGEWEVATGYEPSPEKNPIGRRMHFECDGTLGETVPLDDETKEVFGNSPFTGFSWEFDTENGDRFSLHLTCLVKHW